jgi:two-component system response regulator YesN
MLVLYRLSEILLFGEDIVPGDYRISKTLRHIATHYPEKLTVHGLARQVQLDPDYFGRLFKRETGMTVHQHLTQVRVQNAEKVLQSGQYKVQEAAAQCGFSDAYHFYKSFKALRGFPPSRCIPRE